MLYQITFKGTLTKPGEEPEAIRKVAYVQGESTTDATAQLLKVAQEDKSLNLRVDAVQSISSAPVSEVYFDDTKEEIFYRVRIGYRDTGDKKFKYTYLIVQADSLLTAVAKVDQIGKNNPAAEYVLYNASITENLCIKSLVGDYAAEE
jgi:transcriptional antiterminator Rof (Rho-off)